MEIIDLPNENIGFPKHVVHGPIGTSQGFFPFLTDYFPGKRLGSGEYRLSENSKFIIFNERIVAGGGTPPLP